MKTGLKLLTSLSTLLVILAMNLHCYKDTNCRDEKVGDIYLDDITKAFFPLDTAKALVFKNANGDEMRFVCNNPTFLRIKVAKELKCLQVNFTLNTYFLDADYWELPYYQDGNYSEVIALRFIVNTQSTTVYDSDDKYQIYDLFSARLGDSADADFGNAIITYITSERESKPEELVDVKSALKFRIIADTTIMGKNYSDLIVSVPAIGTQPTEKYALFYQRNVGPVAFNAKDGTTYIFDREE